MISLKKSAGAVLLLAVVSLNSCIKLDTPPLFQNINFQSIALDPESYWNGSVGWGSQTFGIATFNNLYEEYEWGGYWEGFAYSNMTDMETPGFLNQYSAYVDENADPKNVYAVAYVNEESATVTFDREVSPKSVLVTNSTYAYHTIKYGDDFTQPFASGDWFKLTITGYDNANRTVGSIDFYLADYRDGKDKLITNWTSIKLHELDGSSKLIFTLSSSDNSGWGMNTPSYFCLDELAFEFIP